MNEHDDTKKNRTGGVKRVRRVRRVGYAATLVGSALLLSALTGCGDPPPATEQVTPRVKVFVVGKTATGQSRRISGTVRASDRSTLSFGVGGQVVEVIAIEGQAIARGQLLARLDQEPFQIKLEDARAELNKTRAKIVEAQAGYDRTADLVKQRASSQKELDAATADLAEADSDLKAAQSGLDQAELDLKRTNLTAPFAGRVVSVPIDPFQELSASGEAIVLQSEGALDVDVLVPETLIRDVDFGQAVQVTFPTLEGVGVAGVVRTIGADTSTGNAFSVSVRLKETDEDLRAGMTASVTFNFSSYLDARVAYLVPLSALAIDAATTHPDDKKADDNSSERAPLYVLNSTTQKIELRYVRVGDLRGNEMEVFDGLQPGDLVVSAGVAFLRDAMGAARWTPRK